MIKKILILLCLILFSVTAGFGGNGSIYYNSPKEVQSKIISLVDHIMTKMPERLTAIDPEINRIAFYRIKSDPRYFNANLHQLLEGKVLTVFENLGSPKIVVLPKLNGLQIKSTDSTFSVQNSVPSMAELWQMGKKLRIEAFLEGECTYIHTHGLVLNLRLVKTGSGEVLWSDTFSVFEKEIEPVKEANPMYFGLSLGMESYSLKIEEDPFSSSIVASGLNRYINYNTLDLSLYQYLPTRRHFRYEVRTGINFLGSGIKLNNTAFSDDAFYGNSEINPKIPKPVSIRLQTLFYIGMIEKKDRITGDWLSVYLTATRHFAKNTPDFNSVGMGLRTDLSRNFSVSAGFSLIMADEFQSVPIQNQSSTELLNIDMSGIQYHLLLVQYIF